MNNNNNSNNNNNNIPMGEEGGAIGMPEHSSKAEF